MLSRFTSKFTKFTRFNPASFKSTNRFTFRSKFLFSTVEKNRSFLVGVDGTKYSYNALRVAFESSRAGDKVIAVHFPYEPIYSQKLKESQVWKELEEQQDQRTKEIADECHNIARSENPDSKVVFEFILGEATIKPQYDLINVCFTKKISCLVLGSKGLAHSVTQHISKTYQDTIGSCPDYCLHNAPCDVLVVKPHEY